MAEGWDRQATTHQALVKAAAVLVYRALAEMQEQQQA